MQEICLQGKTFKQYLNNQQIRTVVKTLATKLVSDLKEENPVFLIILNGSFIFAADLVRELPAEKNIEIAFLRLSSYCGTESCGEIKQTLSLDTNITNRTIIIIEDIIETGITLYYTLQKLKELNPKKIQICTLFFKPEKFLKSYTIDYVGMSIPNDFIIGYGLDYNNMGRHLKDIYQAK